MTGKELQEYFKGAKMLDRIDREFDEWCKKTKVEDMPSVDEKLAAQL
ncbi:hypothetical protein DSCOOX_03270 [Desulfosarcina ovata subsp. ovata]|uniref:Uncharacterized protein n=1 Tax=Desulfosarcina ovata subsp. ovata TaxID=2752305 RepID=A0A5K8A3X6_9BACT|nr:hypothetical protein DSCOOX_03270 [Desulfosarcina ovata subsp. ovata]